MSWGSDSFCDIIASLVALTFQRLPEVVLVCVPMAAPSCWVGEGVARHVGIFLRLLPPQCF